MLENLLGAVFAIGIFCIIVGMVYAIVQYFSVPIPSIVWTIVWGIVGIVCLILLAQGLGVNIPSM